MSAPLPKALRARCQPYIEEGFRAIRTHGHAEPASQGRPCGRGKLAPYQPFFEELIAQDPDVTLFELRDALTKAEGTGVHHSSISALLSRLGFTDKKNRWWPPSAVAQG